MTTDKAPPTEDTPTPQGSSQDEAMPTAQGHEAGNLVELFRAALMEAHADDWSMETASEAAHICATAMLQAQANNNLAFTRHDRVIAELLDKHSRDMAVLGLKNYGYSTTAMKQTEKLTKRISKYFEQVNDMIATNSSQVEDTPSRPGEHKKQELERGK